MAPLLSVQKATKFIAGKSLFSDLSLVIGERERLAIIGPNGSGKSTLLRIIAGQDDFDSGNIISSKGLRISYVDQQENFAEGDTVYQALARALPRNDEREGAIARALALGQFTKKEQPVHELSGGWRKRLSIVRGLASNPELILLDEPTNHLDIDGVLWLEEILSEATYGVAFISHDRYFIERIAERVIEIDRRYPSGLFSVQGRYSDFIAGRAMFLEQLEQYQDSLANKVRREVEWLRQGARARSTKSKSRIAGAERMIEELQSLNIDARRANFEFGATSRRTKELVKVENISQKLGDKMLFKDVSLILKPDSRLGVIGANGSGKSTFIKTLLGQLKPISGRVVQASGLQVAVFDQNRARLDPNMPLNKALSNGSGSVVYQGKEVHTIGWAKRFLFNTDQLSVPVGKLSGGEQARVYLSQLMLTSADLLLLDEPTNDLDIQTLEVMEESLNQFPGAVVLVTHDRYLLDRVATQVLALDGSGDANLFASYSQWEAAREEQKFQKRGTTSLKESSKTVEKRIDKPPSVKLTHSERAELQKIETRITKAELNVSKIQERFADPTVLSDANKLRELSKELATAQKAVEELYQRWQALEDKKRSDGTI